MTNRQHLRALYSRILLMVGLSVAALGFSPTAIAQTIITKTAGGTDIGAGASWSSGVTPNAGNLGVIDNTWTSASALTFSSTLTIGEIQVKNPLNPIIIQPTTLQTLNLGNLAFTNGGGLDMTNATVGVTFGTNTNTVLQQGSQTWTVGNATSHPGLTVSGTINTNGAGLTIAGTGPATFSGIISGGGGFIQNSSNTTTLSGLNTMSGGVNVGNGTLIISTGGTGVASSLGTGTFGIGTYWTDGGTPTINTPSATAVTIGTNNAIQIDDSFTFTGTGNLNFGTGATTLGVNTTITTGGSTLTFGGVIDDGGAGNSNGLGITKAGSGGTLSLGGINTFTGNMNLTAGTLNLAGNLALQNAVLNATGGTLTITPTNATIGGLAGTQALGLGTTAITLNTSSIQYPNVTYSGVLSGTTATVTKTGTGSQTLSGNNSYTGLTSVTAGTLILSGNNTAATGGVTVTGATLDINNATALGTGTFTINAASTIDNTSGGDIVNANNNAQAWSGNFTYGGTGNLNLGTGAVTMNASRTVTVSASTLTVGGVIGGAFSLTKNGTGTLVLSGASTYTGGLTLNDGTVALNAAGSSTTGPLGTGTFTINGGTLDNTSGGAITLAKNNVQAWDGDFTFAGSNALGLGTGAVTMNASRTVTVSANTLTVGGVIGGGAFSLTKNGTGTLSLTAANTYTGATIINGGVLSVGTLANGGTNSGIGKSAAAAANLIINGGTLQFLGGSAQTTDRLFTIGTNGATLDASGTSAARTIGFGNTGAIAFSSSTAPANLTLTGTNTGANTLTSIIGDSGTGANVTSVVKSGAGEWVLGGANTYTGGTTLNAGTLAISVAGGLGNGTLTINGGTLDNTNAAALTLTNNINQVWNASFGFTGTKSLNMGTGNVTLGNSITLTSSTAANNITIGGVIDDGINSFNLTKAGAGSLVLNGANTFSGNMNMSAGTLTLGNVNALQNAVLNLTGGASQTVTLGVAGTNTYALAGLAATGASNNITIGANTLAINTTAGTTTTFTGNIITGTGSLTIAGSGTQVMAGTASNYSGTTTLSSGTLKINNAAAIGTGNLVITGGNLDAAAITLTNGQNWNGNFTYLGSAALTASGNVVMNASRTVTVSASTLTVSGNISGTGFGLTKNGTGTLVLTGVAGSNTFTGATTVNAGTLSVDFTNNATASATNIITGTSALVLNGGTLSVTGKSANTNSQTFGGTTIGAGASTVTTTQAGATALDVTLGAVTRNAGGTVNFVKPTTGNININGTIVTTGTSGILTSSGTAFATVSGTDFATVSSNHVIAATSTLQNTVSSWAAGNNYVVNAATTGSLGADLAINALKTNGTVAEAINLGGHTLTITTGGIIMSGSSTPTISTGTLKGSNTGELVVVQNSSSTAVISANIVNNTGATGLTKSGTGSLTLSGANTYGGNTTLNSGTLNINSVTALGASGSIFIINGGNIDNTSGSAITLTNNNAQNWLTDFTFTGSNDLGLGTGAVTLGANRTVTVSAKTLTVGGAIGGASFSLTKNGTGNLVLSGTSTYGGGTTINAGVLEVTNNNALGANATTVTVASGATLQLDNGVTTGGQNNATGVTSGDLLNIAGTGVGGGGALVSSGTSDWYGNIALTSAATISSGSTASGVLTLGDALADSAYHSNISLGSNTLTLAGAATTTTQIASNITGTGGVTVNTSGTVKYNMDGNGYTGATAINGGTLVVDSHSNAVPVAAGGGLLAIQGNVTIGDGTGSANTSILQMGDYTLPNHGVDNADETIASDRNVTINKDGEFWLNGQVQHITDLTMTAGYINTTSDINTLTLSPTYGKLYVTGNMQVNADATTAFIDGNFELGNSVGNSINNINVASGGNLTINALLSGGGFLKNGTGVMTLANSNNSFTNTVEVAAGTLVLTAGANVLGATGNGTTVDTGAQLQMAPTADITVAAETITLNGNGTANNGALQNVAHNNTLTGQVLTGANNANINNSGGNLTISGNIGVASGTPTLTFTGINTTTLSGNVNGAQNIVINATSTNKVVMSGSLANTYTGATTVNTGATLELNKSANTAAVSGSTITVNTGGTLLSDQSGQIGDSTHMVLNGGTWTTNGAAAGAWTESLNTLTLSASSTINLGTGSNIISFQASNAATWTPGASLYLDNWNGTLAGGGTDQIKFASGTGLGGTSYTGQLGDIIFVNPTVNGSSYSGNYHAIILGTGEVVPFLPAPEPGTVVAGASLAALAILHEVRRRKNRAAAAQQPPII